MVALFQNASANNETPRPSGSSCKDAISENEVDQPSSLRVKVQIDAESIEGVVEAVDVAKKLAMTMQWMKIHHRIEVTLPQELTG